MLRGSTTIDVNDLSKARQWVLNIYLTGRGSRTLDCLEDGMEERSEEITQRDCILS